MGSFHLHERQRRAVGALGVVWLVMGALLLVFFQTQLLRNPAYALQSDRNRLRPLEVPAPRGAIVDRDGRLVVESVPGYTLLLLPAEADSMRGTLERLAPLLGLGPDRVAELLSTHARAPHQPLVVSDDLSFDQVSAIEERRPRFPEALVEMRPRRRYPAGHAAAHLVGYLGEISESELEDPRFSGYRRGHVVGKAGVERQYDAWLAGEPGVRYVETDALGRIVGGFPTEAAQPPVPGDSLRLTVDLRLQEWLVRIMGDTLRGAVAALDPRTAEVLALHSSPGYDPNVLVGRVPRSTWSELVGDPGRRLLDRAISGLYPPGSTWKLATAGIALELGILGPHQVLPLACRGGMQYGNRFFRCWDRRGHGALDLAGAIAHSCDVYFYQVGLQIGLERLLREGTRLGFSRGTGVDLPAERAGHFPPRLDWYRTRFGRAPTESEVLSLAIGQGANDQTALGMARFFAALATDGTAPPPRVLLAGPPAPPGDTLDLGFSPRTLHALRAGLRDVVRQGGTAHGSALEHWAWSGKTGTSQNPHGEDHGWFVGVGGAPDGPPEIVVAAIVEEGEHGSDVAQVAAKTADYYLRTVRGMPIDTIQTLREHWRTGRYAPWARRWQ